MAKRFVPSHWDVTNISVKQHFGIWEATGFHWIHESCAFIMQVYCVFVEVKEVLGDARSSVPEQKLTDVI